MAAERVEYLPRGFRWKQIPEIGLRVPIRTGWQIDPSVLPNNKGPDILRFVLFDMADPDGNYISSLTIDAAPLHSSYGDEPTEQYARHSLDDFGEGIKALSGVQDLQWMLPMVGSKRLFEEQTDSVTEYWRIMANTLTPMMEEVRTKRVNSYVLSAANLATDTSYNIRFVVPTLLWPEYAETAGVMVDNIMLSRTF